MELLVDFLLRIAHFEVQDGFHLHCADFGAFMSIIGIVDKLKQMEIYNLAAQSHVQVLFDYPEIQLKSILVVYFLYWRLCASVDLQTFAESTRGFWMVKEFRDAYNMLLLTVNSSIMRVSAVARSATATSTWVRVWFSPSRLLPNFLKQSIGIEGEIVWGTTKSNVTLRKLIDVSKLPSLG